jgi:uncharacterized protein YceH (UPF0502 family)
MAKTENDLAARVERLEHIVMKLTELLIPDQPACEIHDGRHAEAAAGAAVQAARHEGRGLGARAMAGSPMAELKRAARRLETIAELTARVAKLEAAIAGMATRLQRLEVRQPHTTMGRGSTKAESEAYEAETPIG